MERIEEQEDYGQPSPFDIQHPVELPEEMFSEVLDTYKEYRAKTASSEFAELPELNRMMSNRIDTFLLLHKSQLTHEIKAHWAVMAELKNSGNEKRIYQHINKTMQMLTDWAKDVGIITGTLQDMIEQLVEEINSEMVLYGDVVHVVQRDKDGKETEIEFEGTFKKFMEERQ